MPASDRLSAFIAAGAWGAIVGGAALVISFLLEWLVVPYENLGVAGADLTASYLVSSGLRLLSAVLFLWALLALYNRQSIAAGTFGLWGFIVAFFGTALLVGNAWAEVFVWPTLARVAPNVVTGQVAAPHLTTGITLSVPVFGIGIVLFGLATLKAGVYPRWAAGLLIVSIPVTIFLPPTEGTFAESIGQIMLGSAFMILGWHALRVAPTRS
ncbi:MAG TPA: hypothetical protein VF086_07105 [Propionibacteriaceae bacterium]